MIGNTQAIIDTAKAIANEEVYGSDNWVGRFVIAQIY